MFSNLTQSPAVSLNGVIFNFGNFVELKTAVFYISNFFSATRNSPLSFSFHHSRLCCCCLSGNLYNRFSSSICWFCFKSSFLCVISSSLSSRHFRSLWLSLPFFHCLTDCGDNPCSIFNSSVCETRSNKFVIMFPAHLLTIFISV